MSDAERAARAPGSGGTRRNRLREYQAQLLARMQAAQAGAGTRSHQLGVEIGAARYLLDLTDASEIVAPGEMTAVPLTLPWYLGLANIRGNLVGVLDLARYFGLGDTASGPDARFVTFAPALGVNCALLVSRVYGLRQGGDMQAEGALLRDADGLAWTPLALGALVREERFLEIGL